MEKEQSGLHAQLGPTSLATAVPLWQPWLFAIQSALQEISRKEPSELTGPTSARGAVLLLRHPQPATER